MAVPNPDADLTKTLALTKRKGHGGPVTPTEYDATLTALDTKIGELVDFVNRLKSGDNIAVGAIDTDHLTNLKVTTEKLADLAVTGAKMANDTVTGTQLENIADVAGSYALGLSTLTVDGQGRVSAVAEGGSSTQTDGLFDAGADYTANPTQGLTWHAIDTSTFPEYTLGTNNPDHATFASLLGSTAKVRLPSPTGYYFGANSGVAQTSHYFSGNDGLDQGYEFDDKNSRVLRVQFSPYIPDTAKAVLVNLHVYEAELYYSPYGLAHPLIVKSTGNGGTATAEEVVLPLEREKTMFMPSPWNTKIDAQVGGNWVNERLTRFYDVVSGDSVNFEDLKVEYKTLGAAKITGTNEGLGDYSWDYYCPAKPYAPLRVVSEEQNDTYSLTYIDLLGYWD